MYIRCRPTESHPLCPIHFSLLFYTTIYLLLVTTTKQNTSFKLRTTVNFSPWSHLFLLHYPSSEDKSLDFKGRTDTVWYFTTVCTTGGEIFIIGNIGSNSRKGSLSELGGNVDLCVVWPYTEKKRNREKETYILSSVRFLYFYLTEGWVFVFGMNWHPVQRVIFCVSQRRSFWKILVHDISYP